MFAVCTGRSQVAAADRWVDQSVDRWGLHVDVQVRVDYTRQEDRRHSRGRVEPYRHVHMAAADLTGTDSTCVLYQALA